MFFLNPKLPIIIVVPTPESAAAFARLVATRERLMAVTRLLNDAQSQTQTGNTPTEGVRAQAARHKQLQAEWDAAYAAFDEATQEFSKVVMSLRNRDDLPAE